MTETCIDKASTTKVIQNKVARLMTGTPVAGQQQTVRWAEPLEQAPHPEPREDPDFRPKRVIQPPLVTSPFVGPQLQETAGTALPLLSRQTAPQEDQEGG
jgi:hypothetical protein